MTTPDMAYRIDQVRWMKEQTVGRSDPSVPHSDDLNPVVEVIRDDEIIVTFFAPDLDRDQGLAAAHLGFVGLDASEIRMVLDVHFSESAINPATGKRWGPGEMQKGCDENGACDLGWATDGMLLLTCDRAGAVSIKVLPYHVHGQTITWAEDWAREADVEGAMNHGIIPDSLRQSIAEADSAEVRAARDELVDAAGRDVADLGVMTVAAEHGFVCATAVILPSE